MGIVPNNHQKKTITMNRKILFWPLAAVLLTACEKGLVDDIEDVGSGQMANSVLQVRTRAGGSVADEATVSYPVTVYVFRGNKCRTVQTIGDEGQMLNIPLVEGSYSVLPLEGLRLTIMFFQMLRML